MGNGYADSDSWTVVSEDGTIVAASRSEATIRSRWEAEVPGTAVLRTPPIVDDYRFLWGAIVPDIGVIGYGSDPDEMTTLADSNGGWVTLIRAYRAPTPKGE